MAALKAVVIIMGVLILAGIAVIAFTIVSRSGRDAASEQGFGAVVLEGVSGCRIADSAVEAGRLVIRTEGEGAGCGRVHVLDLETGRLLGTVGTE